MKYEVGDRVRIKSLDWYNENKDEFGSVNCPPYTFFAIMYQYCGKILTINSADNFSKTYKMTEDGCHFYWTDEMIEGLVEEGTKPKFKIGDKVITNKGYIGRFEGWVSDYQVRVLFVESGCNVVIHPKDLKLMEEETKLNVIEEAKTYWDSIKDAWICPKGYIFKDENGNVINATKIVLEKKKKEYPKTYEECINELDTHKVVATCAWEKEMKALQRLLVCRDAYWKIAGEEMGLRKPWKPIYQDDRQDKHCIYVNIWGITLHQDNIVQHVLTFPTEEMRDTFYENFKELIEQCKELL